MVDLLCPETKTFFIVKNEDASIIHYGEVEPPQCLGTGLLLTTYTDEEEWTDALMAFGVTVGEEELGVLIKEEEVDEEAANLEA